MLQLWLEVNKPNEANTMNWIRKAKVASMKRQAKAKRNAAKEENKSNEQIKFNSANGNKFAVKKKMVLSKNSIVFQKNKNNVSEEKEVDEENKNQENMSKNSVRAKSLLCSPRREPKITQMKDMRTPIIVNRDKSTDASSNLFNSFMNSTEKSMSEKRILNPFKKSNSQELSRFIPTIPDENRKSGCIKTIVPFTTPQTGIKTRCSSSAHKIESKTQNRFEEINEIDESFRRLFDANTTKYQKTGNPDSPRLKIRQNNKDILLDNYFFKLKKRKKDPTSLSNPVSSNPKSSI